MATLIPSYEKVLTMKVKPEAGELYLLKFLDKELDSSFEVYFNPFMNGDRPDIVIMRKGYGVMIIEVKDYNLDLYELDDRKNFVIKSINTKTYKSPAWPPLIPASPSPATRILLPSSTPAGILTDKVFSFLTLPSP